jgi:hypothetical protein
VVPGRRLVKRPEQHRLPLPVPLLTEYFDEDPKADEHLMARIESVGLLSVETYDDAKAGVKVRHG